MILYDIGDNVTIDLEKVEAVVLDKTNGYDQLVCVMGSGLSYPVYENKVSEFFSKLSQIERGDGLAKQYASV